MKIAILIVLFSCMASGVCAEDYDAIVQRAFESNEQTSDEHWAFTETHTSEDVTRVSRFDPRCKEGEQWTLISIDGIPPTTDESEEFMREKAESDDSEAEDGGFGVGFVKLASLELIDETNDTYRFTFRPNVEDDIKDTALMQHVTGILSIDKAAHYVRSINLKSERSFKPERGVKVTSLDISMDFGPALSCGQIVLLSVHARVKGRAYLMFGFDEVEETVYSDYECISPKRGSV